VLYEYPFARQKHTENIELVLLPVTSVTVDPDMRRSRELALFSVMYGLNGVAELVAFARLHFHERDGRIALGDQVDVAPAVAEAAIEDRPAVPRKPAFGDAFAEFAESLVVVRHGGEGMEALVD
jgi:hypothetical protein